MSTVARMEQDKYFVLGFAFIRGIEKDWSFSWIFDTIRIGGIGRVTITIAICKHHQRLISFCVDYCIEAETRGGIK